MNDHAIHHRCHHRALSAPRGAGAGSCLRADAGRKTSHLASPELPRQPLRSFEPSDRIDWAQLLEWTSTHRIADQALAACEEMSE